MREWENVITGSKENPNIRYRNIDQEYLNECVHESKTGFITSWEGDSLISTIQDILYVYQ